MIHSDIHRVKDNTCNFPRGVNRCMYCNDHTVHTTGGATVKDGGRADFVMPWQTNMFQRGLRSLFYSHSLSMVGAVVHSNHRVPTGCSNKQFLFWTLCEEIHETSGSCKLHDFELLCQMNRDQNGVTGHLSDVMQLARP